MLENFGVTVQTKLGHDSTGKTFAVHIVGGEECLEARQTQASIQVIFLYNGS